MLSHHTYPFSSSPTPAQEPQSYLLLHSQNGANGKQKGHYAVTVVLRATSFPWGVPCCCSATLCFLSLPPWLKTSANTLYFSLPHLPQGDWPCTMGEVLGLFLTTASSCSMGWRGKWGTWKQSLNEKSISKNEMTGLCSTQPMLFPHRGYRVKPAWKQMEYQDHGWVLSCWGLVENLNVMQMGEGSIYLSQEPSQGQGEEQRCRTRVRRREMVCWWNLQVKNWKSKISCQQEIVQFSSRACERSGSQSRKCKQIYLRKQLERRKS